MGVPFSSVADLSHRSWMASASSATGRSPARLARPQRSILPAMPAERLMPTEESQDLIDLTRQICADQLAPNVSAAEEAAQFPRSEEHTSELQSLTKLGCRL